MLHFLGECGDAEFPRCTGDFVEHDLCFAPSVLGQSLPCGVDRCCLFLLAKLGPRQVEQLAALLKEPLDQRDRELFQQCSWITVDWVGNLGRSSSFYTINSFDFLWFEGSAGSAADIRT